MCAGLKNSTGDLVVIMDADLQHSPDVIFNGENINESKVLDKRSFYITNCVFFNISSSSNGGAIFCEMNSGDLVYEVLIEQSSFIYCHSSENYGALFFEGDYHLAIKKVCAYMCYTANGKYYQFGYLASWTDDSFINAFNDSSIAYSNKARYGLYMFYLGCGNSMIFSLNSSKNACCLNSCLQYYYYTTISEYNSACVVSFSSFTNNTTYDTGYCLTFDNLNENKFMGYCNILNNVCMRFKKGIIYSNRKLRIINSCILNNIAE